MLSWPCAGRFRTCVVYLALPWAEASDPSPNAAMPTATSSRDGADDIAFRDPEFCIVSLLANRKILRVAPALKIIPRSVQSKRRRQVSHRLVRPRGRRSDVG